jgi:hypothetical protein
MLQAVGLPQGRGEPNETKPGITDQDERLPEQYKSFAEILASGFG